MNSMEQNYCNNCGNYGHLYGNCRHPILSYGVILFRVDELNVPRIIMVERKDTLSFIEFIRGKYKTPENKKYIELLISRMTTVEKKKLLKYSFDELWKKLWIHIDNVNQRIQKEYLKSKTIFEKLKKGLKKDENYYNLETIINESKKNYIMNEWEIPKGRRSGHENNKDCAIREFNEETNIPCGKYRLIKNIIPLIEEYKGINNVRYKHIYYIGKTDEKIDVCIDKTNKNQYTEVKDIAWLTEKECYEKIRDYDSHKKKIVKTFFTLYKNIEMGKLIIKD